MASFVVDSSSNTTSSTISTLFNFLSDFKNFVSILPEDKVENFRFSGNECSFIISGIMPMTIKLLEKKPYEFILFSSNGLSKYNFNLKVNFIGESTTTGQCNVSLSGDLNPIVKAFAEKPLDALVNTMSLKLSQLKIS